MRPGNSKVDGPSFTMAFARVLALALACFLIMLMAFHSLSITGDDDACRWYRYFLLLKRIEDINKALNSQLSHLKQWEVAKTGEAYFCTKDKS